jgi:hypothetical protein
MKKRNIKIIIWSLIIIIIFGILFSQILLISPPFTSCDYSDIDKYSKQVLEKKDPSICNKLAEKCFPDSSPRSSCYQEIAISLKNYSICEKMSRPGVDYCGFQIAIKKQDTSWCYEPKKEGYVNSKEEDTNYCLSSLAAYNENLSICQLIREKETKWGIEDCYYHFVKVSIYELHKEPSDFIGVCKKISNNSKKDSCFLDIGYVSEDKKICDNIINIEKRDQCISGRRVN